MDCSIRIAGSSLGMPICCSSTKLRKQSCNEISCGLSSGGSGRFPKVYANTPNGSAFSSASYGVDSSSSGDVHRRRSSLESLFCYDKPVPEERIDKPIGISLSEKSIGDNPRCSSCHAKGAVLCTTCAGSGLYVDSIMESQGIMVKVRCLGCGGTGNTLCSECGGRGHTGRIYLSCSDVLPLISL